MAPAGAGFGVTSRARTAADGCSLGARLGSLVSGGLLPSLSVALVSSEGHRWVCHHGGQEDGGPQSRGCAALLRWYSLTKPISATLAMSLIEDRLLSLDTRAADVLPALAPFLGQATVEQLLSHRAGFGDWQLDAARWFRDPGDPWPDPRRALSAVLGSRPRHCSRGTLPRSPPRYSNLGYAVLGELLAEVAARPFRQLLSERVLGPLAMAGTGFAMEGKPEVGSAGLQREGGPAVSRSRELSRVQGHLRPWGSMALVLRLLARPFLGSRRGPWLQSRPREIVFSAHGGLVGPARDLLPFLSLHLGLADMPLLSPGALRQMRRPRGRCGTHGAEGTGLGWMLGEELVEGRLLPVCRHGGRGPGFSTEMVLVPQWGLALALLTNIDIDARLLCRALLSHGRRGLLTLAESESSAR